MHLGFRDVRGDSIEIAARLRVDPRAFVGAALKQGVRTLGEFTSERCASAVRFWFQLGSRAHRLVSLQKLGYARTDTMCDRDIRAVKWRRSRGCDPGQILLSLNCEGCSKIAA